MTRVSSRVIGLARSATPAVPACADMGSPPEPRRAQSRPVPGRRGMLANANLATSLVTKNLH